MGEVRTSETLVNFYQTAWRYNSEDSHLPENYFFINATLFHYKDQLSDAV
jgi:hypothetical protein